MLSDEVPEWIGLGIGDGQELRLSRPRSDVDAAAILWMITSLDPAAIRNRLPHGLTVDDALRIAHALDSTHAEATRRVYAHAWRQWERWCGARHIVALPAAPAMICAYLTERASQGAAVSTLDLAASSISYRHRRHGLDDPTRSEAVVQVRRGLRRLVGAAPRRQARPLHTDDIAQIVIAIERSTAKGARDAAIILLGFASCPRTT